MKNKDNKVENRKNNKKRKTSKKVKTEHHRSKPRPIDVLDGRTPAAMPVDDGQKKNEKKKRKYTYKERENILEAEPQPGRNGFPGFPQALGGNLRFASRRQTYNSPLPIPINTRSEKNKPPVPYLKVNSKAYYRPLPLPF